MRFVFLGLLGAVVAACGGKAIIDPAGEGGSSSASSVVTSTNDATVGVTTTSGGCECTTSSQCPTIDDACFDVGCDGCSCVESPLPPGTPCMGGVCDGASSCVECVTDDDCGGGICDDGVCTIGGVEEVCEVVCTAFNECLGPNPDCFEGCGFSLQGCSPNELQQVAACVSFLEPGCDVDGASECIIAIPCAVN